MKPPIAIAFCLLLGLQTFSSRAQKWQLESSYGQLHSGVNQRIGLWLAFDRFSTKLGSTIHFNDQNTADSRNVVYYRTTHSYAWYNSVGAYAGLGYEWYRCYENRIILSTEFDLNFFNSGSLHSFQGWDGATTAEGVPLSQTMVLRHKTPFPQLQTSLLLRSTFQVSEALFTFFEAGVGPYFIRQHRDYMLEARTGNAVYSGNVGWKGDPFAPFLRTGLGISLSQGAFDRKLSA